MRRRVRALRAARRAVAVGPVVTVVTSSLALLAKDVGDDGGHVRRLHGGEHEDEPQQGRDEHEPRNAAANGGRHAPLPLARPREAPLNSASLQAPAQRAVTKGPKARCRGITGRSMARGPGARAAETAGKSATRREIICTWSSRQVTAGVPE